MILALIYLYFRSIYIVVLQLQYRGQLYKARQVIVQYGLKTGTVYGDLGLSGPWMGLSDSTEVPSADIISTPGLYVYMFILLYYSLIIFHSNYIKLYLY